MKIKLYLIIVLVLIILIYIGCSNSDNPTCPQSTAPNAPDSISALVISSTSVLLNWIDNSDNEDVFSLKHSLFNSFSTYTGTTIPADSTSVIICPNSSFVTILPPIF